MVFNNLSRWRKRHADSRVGIELTPQRPQNEDHYNMPVALVTERNGESLAAVSSQHPVTPPMPAVTVQRVLQDSPPDNGCHLPSRRKPIPPPSTGLNTRLMSAEEIRAATRTRLQRMDSGPETDSGLAPRYNGDGVQLLEPTVFSPKVTSSSHTSLHIDTTVTRSRQPTPSPPSSPVQAWDTFLDDKYNELCKDDEKKKTGVSRTQPDKLIDFSKPSIPDLEDLRHPLEMSEPEQERVQRKRLEAFQALTGGMELAPDLIRQRSWETGDEAILAPKPTAKAKGKERVWFNPKQQAETGRTRSQEIDRALQKEVAMLEKLGITAKEKSPKQREKVKKASERPAVSKGEGNGRGGPVKLRGE